MNLLENPDSFFLAYAALEHPRDTALVQLVVDDSVGACSALDLSGGEFVRWQFVVGEVSKEGLGP